MKKVLYSLLQLSLVALLFSSIVSCSKNDAGSNSIIGQWVLTQREIIITALDGTVIQHERQTTADFGTVIYEFKADGTCSMTDNETLKATYMKTGNTLVIVYETYNHSEEATIDELTASSLILSGDVTAGSERGRFKYVFTRK